MSEWIKTTAYAAAALVMIGLAFGAEWLAQPVVPKEFEQVGTEFYPEFENPLAARSLQVTTYDPDTSVIHEFRVNWGDDGWTISPYGYPADAEDQLEKTAASVVGITREGLASRRQSDHERFGVVDPRSTDSTKLTGRGERITLKDENGQVLVDLIIGNPAEDREGYYYVRKPKTDDVYIAQVDVDLSTRFADWINSDLLGINSSDLQRIHVFDYSVNQERGTAEMRGESILINEDAGPWTLKGLDDPSKQVNTAAVNDLTRVLADLKIIGVRPKPKGLNADLSLDPKYISNQLALLALRQNLIDKGFFLTKGSSQGNLQLIGQEGQLIATTSDAIAYDLYFGEQFSGSLYDIEFGAAGAGPRKLKPEGESKENDPASDDQAADSAKDSDDSDKAADAKAPDEDSGNKNAPLTGRYVFVAARYVPESLEKPKPPTPLAKDATDKEKQAAKQAQAAYEKSLDAYNTKVQEAKKKVEELNERFGDWYYVISTENFEDLRLSRKALVEPKEKGKTPLGGTSSQSESIAAKEAVSAKQPPVETATPVSAPRPKAKP